MGDTPLKARLKELKISQRKAGEMIGKDRVTINRWARGKRKPGKEDCALIHEKFGIPPREMRPDLVEMLEGAQ